MELLGSKFRGMRRGLDNVAEEHADLLAFTLDRFPIGQDPLFEMGRRIGRGSRCRINGVAALQAEFRVRR